MKIGVISDTHIPKAMLELPEEVLKAFSHVDLILHAGDLVEISLLETLKKMAPVRAVCGNMDMSEVRDTLPVKDIINIGKFRIGLIHGSGPPKGVADYVKSRFDKNVDVIVFGHTHASYNEVVGNTLLFNPGTPTDKIFAPYNSYGILKVEEKITGRIIRL